MKEYIAKVAEGENLTEEEAKGAMDIMLSGDATQAQIAAFLALERVKGETLDELAGFAAVLRDKAETISPEVDNYIDLVGTGGDRHHLPLTCPLRRRSWWRWQDSRWQTRKPLHIVEIGRRGCVRGARRQYHGRPEESGGVCGEDRNRFHVCAAF